MTPTHTSSVEVPSRIPHRSYDDRVYGAGQNVISSKTPDKSAERPRRAKRYLGLDPDFDEAAQDGEHVADDEQDVPAVDELQPVSQAHAAGEFAFEELHVLLGEETGNDRWQACDLKILKRVCLPLLEMRIITQTVWMHDTCLQSASTLSLLLFLYLFGESAVFLHF